MPMAARRRSARTSDRSSHPVPMKRSPSDPSSLLRPSVTALHGYAPGEQPKLRGAVKLNTNENPYPPAPAVLRAIRKATDGRLRLYPNATSRALREKLASVHGCAPENVFVGNGSDEVLACLVRAFAEPEASVGPRGGSRATVQYPWPAYSLYPVLAAIHGARGVAVPLGPDFGLPTVAELKRGKLWDFDAALTFVTLLSGGFVAGLDGGKIYNTFPLMGGQIVPPGYRIFASWWQNAFENPVAAQFHHRLLAITTAVVLLLLARAAGRAPVLTRLREAAWLMVVVVFVQVALGITTLLLAVPVPLGVMHQLTGVGVLTAVVVAAHRARGDRGLASIPTIFGLLEARLSSCPRCQGRLMKTFANTSTKLRCRRI